MLCLSGCSLFKTYDVSRNLSDSSKKICLSSEGKGRLVVGNRKYIFGYDSGLDEKHANWKLALNFPLQKSEIFELDWSEDGKVIFKSSIDDRLLRENRNINPASLEFFTKSIGQLIQDSLSLKKVGESKAPKFVWKKTKKNLTATDQSKKFKAIFKNMVGDKYFGLMQISYKDGKKNQYRMDLVLKECF